MPTVEIGCAIALGRAQWNVHEGAGRMFEGGGILLEENGREHEPHFVNRGLDE